LTKSFQPSKSTRVKFRKWHRWLGAIIGIQLFFWIVSGIYFSWVPIEMVRGQDRIQKLQVEILPDLALLKTTTELNLPEELSPTQIHLKQDAILGAIYQIHFANNQTHLFDAMSGDAILPLDETTILSFAQRLYDGDFKVRTAKLISDQSPGEFRGRLPVYQVALDDSRDTTFYHDPYNGQVLAVRNNYWRIFDFLWMLHILDFSDRENFNNILLKALSFMSLLLVLSGFCLVLFGRAQKKRA